MESPGQINTAWILMSSLGFGPMTDVKTYTGKKGPESCGRNVCPGSERHFVLQFSQAGSVVMNRSRTFH